MPARSSCASRPAATERHVCAPQAHFSSLPRVPDIVVFVPGDRAAAAPAVPMLVTPLVETATELVLGVDAARRRVVERVVLGLIDAVYRRRWAGVGPVRALRFPALVALGMRDKGDGWDVEMLVRAVKLGLTTDEVALPADCPRRPRRQPRAAAYPASLDHAMI